MDKKKDTNKEELRFLILFKKSPLPSELLDDFLIWVREYNKLEGLSRSRHCSQTEDFFIRWQKMHVRYTDVFEDRGITENGDLVPETWDYLRHWDWRRWEVVIQVEFWGNIKGYNIPLADFMIYYYTVLLPGHFKILSSKQVRYGNMYMHIKYDNNYSFLAGVFLERVPIYGGKEYKVLKGYKYRQVLKLFGIANYTLEHQYSSSIMASYRRFIKEHPNKGLPFHPKTVVAQFKKKDLTYDENFILTMNEGRGRKIYKPTPIDVDAINQGVPVYVPLDVRFKSDMDDDNKVKISEDAENVMNHLENQEMVLKFFESLQEYGIKFSLRQKEMLTAAKNTLVLGRSGTGKTTISAFKVLALDLLFMAFKKKHVYKQSSQKLTLEDFKKLGGCYTIFCTASPVLTNEVKRFYNELIESIKKFLKVRESKKAQKPSAENIEEVKKQDATEKSFENVSGEPTESEASFNAFEELDTQKNENLKESVINDLEDTKNTLLEELEIEKQMTSYNNLKDIPKSEFPLFLTVKKLVYMLDGNCNYSFFSRDTKGKIYGMDSANEWHSESKEGALMINKYQRETIDFDTKLRKLGKEMVEAEEMDEDEKIKVLQNEGIDIEKDQWEDINQLEDEGEDSDYEVNEQLEAFKQLVKGNQNRKSGSKMSLETQYFSEEIDYEVFEKKFWGKNKGSLKLSPVNVWTEIFSVIKGGIGSVGFTYTALRLGVVSWEKYYNMKSSMDYLTKEERRKVYMIYVKYEKWKTENHYYDFMDVVRHVCIFYPYWKQYNLEYLVVDEVQDLTPLTIQLLTLVTNRKIFFCGDTAQTIAKGVGFRFFDLKTVFTMFKLETPMVVQLTKNYRSHKNILELANSIVDIIELYFPQTIDKLQRESSDLDGPKPIILKGYDTKDMDKLVMGQTGNQTAQFGCNQCVIVRNQAAKKNIPVFLRHALCLTVYEAKGLEFDDVILYNFFTDSPCDKQWRLVKDIVVETKQRLKLRFEENMTLDELDMEGYMKMLKRLENEQDVQEDAGYDYETVTELTTTREREEVYRNFGLLCIELKYLYVSITRPKTRLIIYDTDIGSKNSVYDYWEGTGLVDVCHKGEEEKFPILKKAFESTQSEAENKEQWRAMGLKLFKKKFYDSVIQCFDKSGDEDLKIRTIGYMLADEASELTSEAETLLFAARMNKALTKAEKGQKKAEGKSLRKQALVKFKEAGENFEKIKLTKKAAQCAFTCKNYAKAAELFEEAKQYQQAAECHKMVHNFAKAAQMFEESELYLKAFECYEYEEAWEDLLLSLHKHKNKFQKVEERDTLINRYVPIALNSIYQSMNEKGVDEENRGKQLEQKYKKKIEIIEEENEDSDEEEEKSKIELEESHQPSEEVDAKEDNNEQETEEEIITTKSKPEDDKEPTEKASLNNSDISGFDMISKKELSQNFEHLSNFDPDDEFLQSEKSYSVIGSVISKDEEVLSEYSDYSLISNSRISEIKGGNVIETNRDIYMEDVAMQKIIYYISLFSEDVKQYLNKLRSKEGLLQMEDKELTVDYFELELDNIDPGLVKLILDVLEHFDMFRLCLIVCNRYNLKEHVSRYLTSICFKYSNLKLLGMNTVLKMNEENFRTKQKHVNILANEAIHGMLNLIDPKMIQQQKTEELENDTKLMGVECWRYLFYLGFWKKIIYVMDTHSSLQLCYTIGDFENFKAVYLLHYRPELENAQIKELLQNPNEKWLAPQNSPVVDYLAAKVALEESIQTLATETLDSNCE